jgi:hypothetical protein
MIMAERERSAADFVRIPIEVRGVTGSLIAARDPDSDLVVIALSAGMIGYKLTLTRAQEAALARLLQH